MMLCLSLQIGKLDFCWMNVIGKKKHPPQVHYFVLTPFAGSIPASASFHRQNSPTELEKSGVTTNPTISGAVRPCPPMLVKASRALS